MPPKRPQTLDRLMVGLKLKKPGAGLTREQAMAAWPVRNPTLTWRANEHDCVVVDLPRRKDIIGGALSFLFSVPDSKPVVLDEVGSFVWDLCDGDHSVDEIVDELVAEYKEHRRGTEAALTQFLQMLGKRGMVAFAVPREVAEAAGLGGKPLAAGEAPTEPEATTDGPER